MAYHDVSSLCTRVVLILGAEAEFRRPFWIVCVQVVVQVESVSVLLGLFEWVDFLLARVPRDRVVVFHVFP